MASFDIANMRRRETVSVGDYLAELVQSCSSPVSRFQCQIRGSLSAQFSRIGFDHVEYVAAVPVVLVILWKSKDSIL